ncbi:adenylate and guanylate cyclase catalytic domain-containing protein [Mycolicibacterium rhodesiae JS60]|nr:adenylate and guanylate cyclase catalytic domain-containing protein [Mycolicibacterium rhodesiae JS60]
MVSDGITVEEIRDSLAPMLLPARRRFGDDGTYVTAHQISDRTGLDVELLRRFQRASGLPSAEDPDAPVFMRADGDTAEHIKRSLDLGVDAELLLTVIRVLAEGLSRAAEVMLHATVGSVLRP